MTRPNTDTKLKNFRAKKTFDTDEVKTGFSDDQLEALCKPEVGKFGQLKFGLLTGREVYYAAELYSLGRGLRMLARFPQWVPIPANMEHGLDYRTFLEGAQETQRSRYFLSWQGWRARAEASTSKKIHLTLHPMVALRIRLGITRMPSAKGTLIFVPHSLPDWEHAHDFSESMTDFEKLPESFKPLVLCIQMRDIEKGLHKKLRKFGLPIVTTGDVNSKWFADRFYSILRNFEYSSSTDVGSHAVLSEEMGVHFFLIGDRELRASERNHEENRLVTLGDLRYRAEHVEEMFLDFPPIPSVEKDQFLDYCLGTGVPLSVHERELRRLFLRETLLNSPNMFFEGFYRLARKMGIQKLGL